MRLSLLALCLALVACSTSYNTLPVDKSVTELNTDRASLLLATLNDLESNLDLTGLNTNEGANGSASYAVFERLNELYPNIEDFTIETEKLADVTALIALQNYQKLKRLTLYTDDLSPNIGLVAPYLSRFDISLDAYNPSPETFLWLARLPSITTLTIFQSIPNLEALTSLNRLTTLHLIDCAPISDEQLSTIVACKSLSELRLTRTELTQTQKIRLRVARPSLLID